MLHTESEFEVEFVNGTLLVNGEPRQHLLDVVDRKYTARTYLRSCGELKRLVSQAIAVGEANYRRVHRMVPVMAGTRV